MSKIELQERLKVIETLMAEFYDRFRDLQEEKTELTKELEGYAVTERIIAENETLIENER